MSSTSLAHARLTSSPPDTPSPTLYRVSDDVEFAIDIFEYEAGQKKPFKWVLPYRTYSSDLPAYLHEVAASLPSSFQHLNLL